ncbi:TIMELESS-interacting protein-like [Patiria miniata]|uniref:TIMELESS-interacting protein n=1 Tax=Patiria miniata TaxID=46514 RepID=A0A914BM70_PATMI|nr:TIMELESS-interacting protein-like [Patiria miniata]
MQSISLDMDEVHGAEDGYISDEEFPPLAGDLPPLSPTRSTAGHVGEDDNALGNWAGSDADKENQGDKKRPRRLVNRKPQPKLDAVRLCSDRGLPTLSKHFEQVKFKGKGHEVGDLNRLMSTMEHWAHRLFPKMPFDEVIERIEKLGKKRQVQTCIKKIRLDMPLMDEDYEEQEAEPEGSDALNGRGDDEVEMDAFSQSAAPPSQTMATAVADTSVSLSDEQKERMERNKRLAMERRKSKGPATPAGHQAPITADEIQDLEREHADEEDMENELWNDIAMFEADQRNIWKTSPAETAAKETDSVQTPASKETTGIANNPARPEDGQRLSQEIIDIDAQVLEEDTEIVQGEKEAGFEEVIDVDRGAEEEKTNVLRKDSKEVVDTDDEDMDEERGTLAEEKRDEIVETVDVDAENQGDKLDDEAKEDGEGNMSSDLVLKWDSESADESMIIQEPQE